MNSAAPSSSSLSKICEMSLLGVRSLSSDSSVSLLLSSFFSSKLASNFCLAAADFYLLGLFKSWSGFP